MPRFIGAGDQTRTPMNYIIIFCFILISILFGSIYGFAESIPASENTSEYNLSEVSGMDLTGTKAGSDLAGLLNLLDTLGMDISYGTKGETIFGMVADSMNQIINSLSSGDTSGFLDIPLIQETFKYFGMSPQEIVINPENITGEMDAVMNFNRQYQLRNQTP
ncbi:MAG TPA: hypothetical protein VN372_12280 [Methanospirillum sp.]|nr:hypothetical protein [Methanospirillum sp.]